MRDPTTAQPGRATRRPRPGGVRASVRAAVGAGLAAVAVANLGAKPRLTAPLDTLSWSADARFVIAGGPDAGAVRVDTKGRATEVPAEGLHDVRLSPDGRLVLGARGKAFVAVDLDTGSIEETPMGDQQGKPVVWTRGPFGDVIVTKTVAHYSIRRTGGKASDADAAPTQNFRALWVDPAEPLAYVDTGYGLEVRHLRTGLTLRVFDSGRRDQRYVGAVRDAHGRLVLAVVDADGFRLWTPPDPPGTTWDIPKDAPVAMSGDALQVAVGTDRAVEVFAASTRVLRATFKTKAKPVRVAFAPDGRHVAAALEDGTIGVWATDPDGLLVPIERTLSDVDVGRIRSDAIGRGELPVRRATHQFGLSGATAHLHWAPTGQLAGWVDGRLCSVDPATGAETAMLAGGDPGRPFAWSDSGRQLATVLDDGVVVFDTKRWRVVRTLPTGGHHNQLQWRGDVLAVDAGSGEVQAWSPTTGSAHGDVFRASVEATSHFSLSPDGSLLAVTGRTPAVVRAVDGEPVARLSGQWAGVVTATWSPDGRRLATAGGDSTVLVWDTSTWAPMALLEGAHGRELAFSPDGSKLVSASWDGAVVANVADGVLEEKLAFEGLLAAVDWGAQGIAMVDTGGSLYLWP